MTTEHGELIDKLGGYVEVAAKLHRHPTTVFRWQTTGIPPEVWADIACLAKRKRIAGATVEALARSSPRFGKSSGRLKAAAAASAG